MCLPVMYRALNVICSVDIATETVQNTGLPVVSISLLCEASSVGVNGLIRDKHLSLFILGANSISYTYLLQ
jgi:hypothetical protein